MIRLSRSLSLFVGIAFVIIGALHTQVHYTALANPSVESVVSGEIALMEAPADTWRLWQGFSLMMGLGLMTVGLLNVAFVQTLPQTRSMPLAITLIMIAFLGAVAYSGLAFFSPFQLYGGIVGIVLEVVVLALGMMKQPVPKPFRKA